MKVIHKQSSTYKVTKLEFPSNSFFTINAYFHQHEPHKAFAESVEAMQERERLASTTTDFYFSGTLYLLEDQEGRYELVREEEFKENYLEVKE